MKILVPLEPVPNPALWGVGQGPSDSAPMPAAGDAYLNPFDEHALESALRLTEDGRKPKERLGEVVAVTVGPPGTEPVLRTALAQGAQRAIHVVAPEESLDGRVVALALAEVARREAPALILLGKQSAAWENAQTGARLAEALGWPFASRVRSIDADPCGVGLWTEVDGWRRQLRIAYPLIVSVDLDVTSPSGSRGPSHAPDQVYYEGVRFAPLPAVMRAKRKPIESFPLATLVPQAPFSVQAVRFARPFPRPPCRMVADARELVDFLRPIIEEA